MNTNYGQRKCLSCGTTFEATYANHVCCSEACQGKRRNQLKRMSDTRVALRRKEEVEGLKKRVAEQKEEIEYLKRTESHELKEARKALEQLHAELQHTQLELSRKQTELKAAQNTGTAKVAEPATMKHLQKENTYLKSYVKDLEERLQACGAIV